MNNQIVPANQTLGANSPLTGSNRSKIEDQRLTADISQATLSNELFVRLVAKDKKFTKVDFKYSIFDACYLRDCVFDSCNFTGSRFVGTNLTGSSFTGCVFDYATFERTVVDEDILTSGCPGYENLKLKFARSLRVNFQQIGNADGVNKAIRIELQATEIHLRKAWNSNESYYRKKYAGFQRIRKLFEWGKFKVLDLIWGNGESSLKLGRAVLVSLLLMTTVDVFAFHNPLSVLDYFTSFVIMPPIFLGAIAPDQYPKSYLALITFIRLVSFALFTSIVVKRLNRR